MSVKKHLADTMKKLYSKGHVSIRDGNVSFKPKNSNYFYISAGSVRKDELTMDQILRVDFDEKKNLHYDKNYMYKPSREINMHSFLQTDPTYYGKNTFIVHAHPKNIISFMGINKHRELRTVMDAFPELNVGKIGRNVKYHDAGSHALADNCFYNLIGQEIVGLERHGSLSIGENVDRIFENIETLEYYIGCILNTKE
tara:strand:- start:645 stop:1238 length:594 start_codon:yes stop_codon:yes gene_type:complete